nr:hypothetical protein [Clostridioides sp.]
MNNEGFIIVCNTCGAKLELNNNQKNNQEDVKIVSFSNEDVILKCNKCGRIAIIRLEVI